MKRALAACALALAAGAAAWQGVGALQNQATPAADPAPPIVQPTTEAASEDGEAAPDAPRASAPRAPATIRVATPMNQRVAVIGVLNKRNGIARDVTLRPGQAIRVGDVIVRLRACDMTAPWEPQKLTGAFIQTDVRGRDDKWRRVFSGWLYKESPSLNVVEHPVYDVWPKSCAMKHPEIGPDTTAAGSSGAARRSNAKKSGDPAPEGPSPSAVSNSAT